MTETTSIPAPKAPRLPREERDRRVIGVLWRIMVLNILVSVLKLVAGYFAGAVSMLADGLHSLLDGTSNIVGLVGIHVARKGPDAEHPYGHRKFEALAAVGISMFLFITSTEVLREVIGRFQGRHEVRPTWMTFAVILLTLAINIFVTRYESAQGRKLKSSILLADSKHTQSDIFVSLGVIVSLVAALLNFPILDVVVAIFIVGVIAYSGFQIVAGAFNVLSDSQVVDPAAVIAIAKGVEGVISSHHVRSRGLPDDIHVDLHIHVSPEMTTLRAHQLAHVVSDRIKEHLEGVTDVVVHVEPEGEHEEH